MGSGYDMTRDRASGAVEVNDQQKRTYYEATKQRAYSDLISCLHTYPYIICQLNTSPKAVVAYSDSL